MAIINQTLWKFILKVTQFFLLQHVTFCKNLIYEKETSCFEKITAMLYLMFCLVQLYSDVPLESHPISLIKYPKAGDDNGVKYTEVHTDNSVFRQHRRYVLREIECFNFLIQNCMKRKGQRKGEKSS